jgi:hypothetical protein
VLGRQLDCHIARSCRIAIRTSIFLLVRDSQAVTDRRDATAESDSQELFLFSQPVFPLPKRGDHPVDLRGELSDLVPALAGHRIGETAIPMASVRLTRFKSSAAMPSAADRANASAFPTPRATC